MLKVIMLSVTMLKVIILSGAMLSGAMLKAIMLSVVGFFNKLFIKNRITIKRLYLCSVEVT